MPTNMNPVKLQPPPPAPGETGYRYPEHRNFVHFRFAVFKEDWILVTYLNDSNEPHIFHNDFPGVCAAFWDAVCDHTLWLGFNATRYDRYILAEIIARGTSANPPASLKTLSDGLINDFDNTPKADDVVHDLCCFDTKTDAFKKLSLQQLEGMAGMRIVECPVPFDINRKLTENELTAVIDYCKTEAKASRYFFEMYGHLEYEAKQFFIEDCEKHPERYTQPLAATDICRSNASLAAKILDGNKQGKRYKQDLDKVEPLVHFEFENKEYAKIAAWQTQGAGSVPVKTGGSITFPSKEFAVWGLPHTFSDGGLHGASRTPCYYYGQIFHADVNSYYPSIMAAFDAGKRVMNNHPMLKHILERNLELKRKGDKQARYPYKLMANSVFGNTGYEYSPIYDPVCRRQVCVTGQQMLLKLIDLFEAWAGEDTLKLIQSNTDGIICALRKPEHLDVCKAVIDMWEELFDSKITMDVETYTGLIVQKDVNNYVICDTDGNVLESKGGIVKCVEPQYNLPIIPKAILAYFGEVARCGDTSLLEHPDYQLFEQTIRSCTELIEFQIVVNGGAKCVGFVGGENTECGKNPHIYANKILRVFASRDTAKPRLYRLFDAQGNNVTLTKVGECPEHCFFNNGSMYDETGVPLQVPDELDYEWYCQYGRGKLNQFLGIQAKPEPAQVIETAQVPETAHNPEYVNNLECAKLSEAGKALIWKYTLQDLRKQGFTQGSSMATKFFNGHETWECRMTTPDDKRKATSAVLHLHFMRKPSEIYAHMYSFRDSCKKYQWYIKSKPDLLKQLAELSKGVTPATQAEMDAYVKEMRKQEKQKREQALTKARQAYENAIPVKAALELEAKTNQNFTGLTYLRNKKLLDVVLEDPNGIKVVTEHTKDALSIEAFGHLAVPFRSRRTGRGVTVQFIGDNSDNHGDTNKLFAPECTVTEDAAFVIQGDNNYPPVLVEGMATGFAAQVVLQKRTGVKCTVHVCGDVRKLEKHARFLLDRKYYKNIIIAADNDYKGLEQPNVGLDAARLLQQEYPNRIKVVYYRRNAI